MGKVLPRNARRQTPAALTVAEAVDTFLERDWSEHTRRNFASDLKRFRTEPPLKQPVSGCRYSEPII